jgi:methionyl-tRNA formyltransferase
MLNTIIFVCGVPEFVSLAEGKLRALKPDVGFVSVATASALFDLKDELLASARLIGFVTGIIVPPATLAKLGFGAYNFHPGPPEYPGWDPIRFALYEGSRDFGVTAHVMTASVDAGAIVGVRRFRVREHPTYVDYQAEMVAALLALFNEFAAALVLSPGGPPAIGLDWGDRRFTRADAAALCRIAPDIDPAELRRRIRAFGGGELSLRPTIELNGAKFVYAQDELFRGG